MMFQVSRSRIVDRWQRAPWGRGRITLAGDLAHPMTPNLGQGGCTALEDAVVLAAEVGPTWPPADGSRWQSPSTSTGEEGDSLASALRRYEERRSSRCLPLTVKSNLMGVALQSSLPPVCLARDLFIQSPLFSPAHFLDSARFDVTQSDGTTTSKPV